MINYIKSGFSELMRGGFRSVLTISGIAIGVMSVAVISSIGQIGKNAVGTQMNGMGLNSIVVSASAETENIVLWEDELAAINSIDGIERAMPLMNYYTKIRVLDDEFMCMAWGVNQDADRIISLETVYGRKLNRGDISGGEKVCIVDEQIGLDTYGRGNIVGKEINVTVDDREEKFRVVGVVKNGVNMLQNMFGEFIPSFIYLPYTTLSDESGQKKFDRIAVKISDNADSEEIEMKINAAVADEYTAESGITIENLLKQKDRLDGIMDTISAVLSVIAGISLIVSGLSIMSLMLVSVNEKTREIGIKKSIGAKNRDIMSEFMVQSALITVAGGIIGTASGLFIVLVGCIVIGQKPAFDAVSLIVTLLLSVIIGLVFGVYPALKAAKLKPVDALRHQ